MLMSEIRPATATGGAAGDWAGCSTRSQDVENRADNAASAGTIRADNFFLVLKFFILNEF